MNTATQPKAPGLSVHLAAPASHGHLLGSLSMHLSLVVAASLSLIGPALLPDDDLAKEVSKFQGTWVMASGEKDGAKIDDELVKKNKIVWKGKKVELESPHQSKETIKATTVVDVTKNPKQMDWVRENGPDAGKTMYAIYEWIDPDLYRICFASAGKDRPKGFATKPGSGRFLHVWKRVKE
jgi:uncharacterized protein (TIGR03067 family)